MTQTAGERIHVKYAAALQRAAQESGQPLEWTEAEEVALQKASESADRAEQVKALLDTELARPEPNDQKVTRLSAEWRLLNKAEIDYLWRLHAGLGPAKSERHVRAGRLAHARQPARGA